MVKTVKASVYDENYYYGMGGNESFFSKDYSHSIYNKIVAMVEKVKNLRGTTVLDVGCGRGDLFYLIAPEIRKGIGVDYSQDGIALAEKHCRTKTNISFQVSNSAKVQKKFLGMFDVIFLLDVVEHLTPRQLSLTLTNLRKYLKNDGVLVIHTFPNKIMNDLAHIICRARGIESIGMKVHINCQTRGRLVSLLTKLKYKIIFASVDSQKDIFRINIFFRENIVDRIYNNRYLQEIIKKTPIFSDIFFSDIYIIAGR